LLLCCVGGIGFVAYRWGSVARPAPQQDGLVAKAQDGLAKAPAKGLDQPEKPATPLDYEVVDCWKIYGEYQRNEASADAKYLKKPIQFTLASRGAFGVEKDAKGNYYARVAIPDCPTKEYPHLVLYFRKASEVASLIGNPFTVRGICTGKKGTVATQIWDMLGGTYRQVGNLPTVVFEDCELVVKPASKPADKIVLSAPLLPDKSGKPLELEDVLGRLAVQKTEMKKSKLDGYDSNYVLGKHASEQVGWHGTKLRGEGKLSGNPLLNPNFKRVHVTLIVTKDGLGTQLIRTWATTPYQLGDLKAGEIVEFQGILIRNKGRYDEPDIVVEDCTYARKK
jgi:hypothetical protein